MSQSKSADISVPQDLAESWKFSGRGVQQANTPLLIAGDRLIGLRDRTLYAIDLYLGHEIKEPKGLGFPHRVTSTDAFATEAPAIVGGSGAVFFPAADTDGNGILQALRLIDGLPLPGWKAPAFDAIQSLTMDGDRIVVVGQDASGDTLVSGVSAIDGTTIWGPLTPTQLSSGAVGCGDGAIFFASGRQLFAVNTGSGNTRFPRPKDPAPPRYNISELIAPLVVIPPAPSKDKGVVICVGDQVRAFEIQTGVLRWAFDAPNDKINDRVTAALSDDGTLVAVVSDGNVLFVLDALNGDKKWQQAIGYAGTPVIAGDTAFVSGPGQRIIASFDLKTGSNSVAYALGTDVSAVPPAIGNGHIYIQDSGGAIHAKPYASQSAAYFDGRTAYVEIAADGGQFDFGTGDFTVEAWVRSSEGGEVLCGYPTDETGTGFRLNLSKRGEFRFAVTDITDTNRDLAKSQPTRVTDGLWHHIAVVRKNGDISFFADSIASSPASRVIRDGKAVHANGFALDDDAKRRRDLLTQPPKPTQVEISGGNKLYIGWDRFGEKANAPAPVHFTGLIREVRLWNKALDAATIKSRQSKVLGPKGAPDGSDPRVKANEPQLLGNWHLDETYDTDAQVTIENDVADHEFAATFHAARARISDLDLDLSAFPYLLDRIELQWPYASAWSTRGEHDLSTSPALSSNGYLCFGANDNLYGVRRLDGARQWSLKLPGHSSPVAAGTLFYLQTVERGVMVVDAATGAAVEVAVFQGLPLASDRKGHLSAPAASGNFLAVAAQSGDVWIANPSAPNASGRIAFTTGRQPSDLQFAGTLVCCVAGEATALRLYAYDIAKKKIVIDEPADSQAFTLCDNRVFFTQGQKLVVIDTGKSATDGNYRIATSSLVASQITGLAADSDSNILAVSTSAGQIHGLSMATLLKRWSASVPDGPVNDRAKGYVNAPTIADRAIYCTSRSGTVAAFDAASGRQLGLFFEPTAVITSALVQAGTAFFGCAAAAPTAPLDGALHSVVFGDTRALRLGVDAFDKPTASGYASIARDKPLIVGKDGACCAEAWINANMTVDAKGGEILSIRPAAKSNAGLRLFLDADGKVHFIGHNRSASGGWDGVHVQTLHPTSLRDGQWHHIAASRAGARDVRIYVDGLQQEIGTPASAPLATDDLAGDAFEIRIGAPAYQAQPGADTCFHGLIGDVRLWETYLPADQISARMHTKLRGDEFSLVAFWDFNTQGVHDMARNGYDGTLVSADGADSATFWLCDLTFAQPDYPDVTTSARIVNDGEGTAVSGTKNNAYAKTVYELTINCTRADRSPLPDALLRLWYVAHEGEQQPQSITLSTSGANPHGKPTPPVTTPQNLSPIAADQEGTAQNPGFVVYTDAAGRAVIKVEATGDHGPSLALAADFMPPNERFHINVLIDSQSLARPLPPSLMVQTKLVQDYAYTHGDKIDDSRSRNTYRAIITAMNADHTPRPYEWLEISALGYTTIEVDDKKFQVNPLNAQTFQADAKGQLAVVVDATDLKTADLSVWAGFMHQGERVTIALDQDAHQSMSKIDGDGMKDDDRLINWKRDEDGGPVKGPLLKGDYKDHADNVAAAIRHVSSATQPSPPAAASAPPPVLKAGAPRFDAKGAMRQPILQAGDAARTPVAIDRFPDMRQPIRPAYGDRGQALRTLKHVVRRTPVTPESVLASIRKASGGDHVGFYMSFAGRGAAGLEFGHFTTADADHHMGRTRPPTKQSRAGTPVGWFGSDLCDDCESLADQAIDAAKEAAEAAQKLAVEIGDKVTVAIQYVDKVVNVVVNSIVEAMEIVATFLEKIALLIVEFIEFLLFLFDWKAILETHRILKKSMFAAVDYLLDDGKMGANMARAVGQAFKSIPGLGSVAGAVQHEAAQINPRDHLAAAPDDPRDHSDANGVPGSKILSKIVDFCTGGDGSGGNPLGALEAKIEKYAGDAASVLAKLPALVTASPSDMGTNLLDILKTVGSDLESMIANDLADAIDAVVPKVKAEAIDVSFDIPFISQIYEWLTGDDLTLVDATCLMLAIPMNIVYGVATGGRHFNDDADGLEDLIGKLHRASEPFALAVGMPEWTEKTEGGVTTAFDALIETPIPWGPKVEIGIITLRTFQGVFATVMDSTFKYGKNQSDARLYGLILTGVLGATAGVLQSRSFQPQLYAWMTREGFKIDPKFVEDLGYANLAVSVFPAVVAFESYIARKAASEDERDAAECLALVLNMLATAVAILGNLGLAVGISRSCAEADPLKALWLSFAAQTLQSLSQMDGFVYTQSGGMLIGANQTTYEGIAALHVVERFASGAAQLAAGRVLGSH